ncbi:MAG: Thiol-disulfide oxidoreductase ResA [Steroidobacteraceae bacterium]|nr:Thiol-disulfide oxidoreductase ResA [Steroidobacteraceae bacterium]
MKRRAFIPTAVAALIAARAAAAAAPASTPASPGADAALPLADAARLRAILDAYRGKVVVLNLWASWCVPCLREIPDLVRIEKELAPRGVVLVGVSMDEPGDAARVAAFRAQHFPQFRTWLRAESELDAIASVVDPAWNEVLPTTYVLGRDGKVARRVQGAKTHDEFVSLIESAL